MEIFSLSYKYYDSIIGSIAIGVDRIFSKVQKYTIEMQIGKFLISPIRKIVFLPVLPYILLFKKNTYFFHSFYLGIIYKE